MNCKILSKLCTLALAESVSPWCITNNLLLCPLLEWFDDVPEKIINNIYIFLQKWSGIVVQNIRKYKKIYRNYGIVGGVVSPLSQLNDNNYNAVRSEDGSWVYV